MRTYNNIDLVMWGNDNNYPKRVIEMAMQSPELLALIDFMVTVLYGDGVGYEVYSGLDTKGTHTWKPGFDPEVEDWLAMNDIQNYFLELVMDQVWFNHGFTELIKNKKSNYIAQVAHQEAAFCRFGKQNPATGYNDMVYINANWPAASMYDALTTPVPVLDTRDIYAAQRFLQSRKFKSVFPTNYPSPGSLIYQLPGWHALFSSKWFDISKLIPILKHALMKFQMTIKYLMEVPEEFWKIQARDRNMSWETMTPVEKSNLKKLVKKEMDKFLTGAENTGKTLLTTFGWDKVNKVKIPGVSITVLDDKLQDGKYIMDSKEASGQFARAFTIPQPLMGPISAGDMGAGSGTDARVHWNMLNARMKSRKVRNLGALNFVARCNQWPTRMPGFRFYVKDIVMDTLDVNHSTSNPKQNSNPTNGNSDQ
ncbi:MAG TPA: hypothetical protein VHA56_16130 [Mucilaginibacter sp.]|nr:hypothetical protein [Mucilaginibacter sp.]